VLITKQRSGFKVFTTFSFLSMEPVISNQLVHENQSFRSNLFANPFPRNGPHVSRNWRRGRLGCLTIGGKVNVSKF
jgi:hypothetical protein